MAQQVGQKICCSRNGLVEATGITLISRGSNFNKQLTDFTHQISTSGLWLIRFGWKDLEESERLITGASCDGLSMWTHRKIKDTTRVRYERYVRCTRWIMLNMIEVFRSSGESTYPSG